MTKLKSDKEFSISFVTFWPTLVYFDIDFVAHNKVKANILDLPVAGNKVKVFAHLDLEGDEVSIKKCK